MTGASGIRAGKAFVELFVDRARLARGLRQASAQLRSWGQSMTAIGARMLAIGAGAAVPMALATKQFASFEDQMLSVKAVAGATAEEFKRLYDQAKLLGRTTSFTAVEVGAGQLNLARAGFAPEEIEAAIPAVLDLARATGTELANAADIAGGTLRAFALEADEMGRVADVLVATANNSAQTMEDLGESMKYVAPIAEEAGMTLEQTAKAVGVLANMQIKGSMAGTSLRRILLSVANPAVQKKLREIGVSATDAAGDLRPIGDVMLEIGQAIADLPTAKRLAIMQELFDQRAAGAAAKLAKSDFPALSQAIDQAGGTARKTARVMDSGLGGAMRRLWSAVEGVQISIGEAISQAFAPLVDILALAATKVAEWIAANKEIVVWTATIIGAVVGLGAVLVAAGLSFTILGSAIAGVLGFLGAIATAVSAVLSPVGLAIAAIGGLTGAMLHFSGIGGEVLGWIGRQFEALKTTALEAWKGISDALAAGDIALAAKVLWTTLKLEWQKGVQAVNRLWEDAKWYFFAVWNEATTYLARAFTAAWASLKSGWVEVVSFMQSAWSNFTTFFANAWNIAQKKIGEWLLWALEKIGLLSEEATKIAQQNLSKTLDDKTRGRTEENARRQKQIDEERRQDLAQIEQQERDANQVLEDDKRRYYDGLNRQYDRDLAAAEDAAEGAKRQWREALDEAARGREQAEAAAELEAAGKGGAGLKAAAAGVPGLAEVERKLSVQGSFSAFAARGFGAGGTAAERTAKATEKVAENTDALRRQADHGGLVFT